MDMEKIAKRRSRYESGIITAREWANSLLYDLVSAPELDTAFVASLDSLPQGVGQEFRSVMARIAAADFHWTPFFLTSTPAPSDPTKYADRLRQVQALLEQGEPNSEDPRRTEPANQEAIGAARASS